MSDLSIESLPRREKEVETSPFSIPAALWKFLNKRGIKTESQLEDLLRCSMGTLRSPFSLLGMKIAVERLTEAFSNSERIALYGDFDLDGTPGLVLLYEGLTKLGFKKIDIYQPLRISQGYGVHKAIIDDIAHSKATLMVTVDVGITDCEAIGYAAELGIDTIVTDHHLPKEVLPPAVAIINPNQQDCTANLGHLCGTGVAFYLVLALRSHFKAKKILQNDFDPKVLLDLFAIGTVTDMVPLISENRVLVKHGLKTLENTQRPSLRLLINALELGDRELSTSDIGFKIAPKLNALSRLEKGLRPLDLLLETEDLKLSKWIPEVFELHKERVALQEKSYKRCIKILAENPPVDFIWIHHADFHKGIIGLVATKLSQEFGLPAFVGSLNKDGKISGSARVPKEGVLNLQEALGYCKTILNKFGGHAPAAGFEVNAEESDNFNNALTNYFNEFPLDWNQSENTDYDIELPFDEVNLDLLQWMDKLEPFGKEFERPIFKISGLVAKEIRALKNGEHYKIKVGPPQRAHSLDVLWFSTPKNHPNHPEKINLESTQIEVIGQLQINEYMGRKSIQLLLSSIKTVSK